MLDLEGERGSDSEREMSEEAGKKNATGMRELFYVIWQMLPFPANPNPQPEGRLAISLIGGGLEGGGDKEWAKKRDLKKGLFSLSFPLSEKATPPVSTLPPCQPSEG